MSVFLIVGGHDESFFYLKEMNIEFVAIQTPLMIGDELRSLAKEIVIVEKLTNEAVYTAAKTLHETHCIDFIFSFTEDGLLPAAHAAKTLEIPGMDYDSCLLCRDKEALRKYLQHTNFSVPSIRCNQLADLQAFLTEMSTSVVLKDSFGAGSKDVFVCHSKDDAIKNWHKLKKDGCENILAELFLDGEELSLETLTINGHHEFLGVTKKILFPGTVVEQQHIFPAPDIDEQTHQRLSSYALELLDTIAYKHGPCHIEVIINKNGIHLVEINNRGGGDFIWQMVLLVCGVDVIRETLFYAFSHNIEQSIRERNKKYNMMSSFAFFAPIDFEALRKKLEPLAEIVRGSCKQDIGQSLDIKNSWDRFGFCVIGNDNTHVFKEQLPLINQLVYNAENQIRKARELIAIPS